MARIDFIFTSVNTDNSNHDSNNYDPIPAGEYVLRIVNAEVKVTKNAQGEYVKAEFVVIAPHHTGRRLWEVYNIRNNSVQAEEIGRAQLLRLCQACGIKDKLTDTDELKEHIIRATVAIEESKNPAYPEPRNRIKKYEPRMDNMTDSELLKLVNETKNTPQSTLLQQTPQTTPIPPTNDPNFGANIQQQEFAPDFQNLGGATASTETSMQNVPWKF